MAGFIQIVEYTTSRFDEVKALSEDYRDRSNTEGSVRRVNVGADRDRPNVYVTIAEFESYDEAMKNSQRPETQQFAEQMSKLCEGPPTFRNLDVRESFTA